MDDTQKYQLGENHPIAIVCKMPGENRAVLLKQRLEKFIPTMKIILVPYSSETSIYYIAAAKVVLFLYYDELKDLHELKELFKVSHGGLQVLITEGNMPKGLYGFEFAKSDVIDITNDNLFRKLCGDIERNLGLNLPDYNIMSADDAVDLGLSVKWSSHNLGARAEDMSGDYFQWASITPEDGVLQRHPYCGKSSCHMDITDDGVLMTEAIPSHSKYNRFDGLTSVQPCDDAARMILGKNWRMPTAEEFQELADNCDWEWIDEGEKSADNDSTCRYKTKGYLVTSKINGNSIFIPSTGFVEYSDGSTHNFSFFWTSQLDDDKCPKCFIKSKKGSCIQSHEQEEAMCIRPVWTGETTDSKTSSTCKEKTPRKAASQSVFISYSRKQLKETAEIAEAIQRDTPFTPWVDLQGISSGANFHSVLKYAIDNATAVVLIATDDAIDSQYVRMEISYALSIKKPVIPILVEHVFNIDMLDFLTNGAPPLDWKKTDERNLIYRKLQSMNNAELKETTSLAMKNEAATIHPNMDLQVDGFAHEGHAMDIIFDINPYVTDEVSILFAYEQSNQMACEITYNILNSDTGPYKYCDWGVNDDRYSPDNIDKYDIVIVMLSETVSINDSISKLMAYAKACGKIIIPIWCGKSTTPQGWSAFDLAYTGYINGHNKAELSQLIFRIKKFIEDLDETCNKEAHNRFLHLHAFHEGFAALEYNGYWGFTNTQGQMITNNEFHNVLDFNDGMAAVENDEGKWGFINQEGKLAIPFIYDEVESFSEGLAYVRQGTTHEFIDKEGGVAFSLSKLGLGPYHKMFSEGLLGVRDHFTVSFVDKRGEIVISTLFSEASSFVDGYCVVNDEYSAIMNRKGRLITDICYEWINVFSEGLAPFIRNINGEWLHGYLSTDGTEVIKPIYNHSTPFHNGLACVSKKGEKYCFIDKSGKRVSDFFDLGFKVYDNGFVIVEKDSKCYIMDTQCNMLETNCEYADGFSEGMAKAHIYDKDCHYKDCFLKTDGSILLVDGLIKDKFREGFAIISKKNVHYFIDKSGNRLLIKYKKIKRRVPHE